MIKRFLLVLATGMLAVHAAKAATIDFESDTVGASPSGVPGLYTTNGNATVQNTNVGGQYVAPVGDTSKYLAVQGGQTETFTSQIGGLKNISFLWGSIDSYNTVTFSGPNGSVSLTGTQVEALTGHNEHDTFVFTLSSPIAYNSVTFASSVNAFELDNIRVSTSVPDGGTTAALLGLSMLGLVAVRSKLSAA